MENQEIKSFETSDGKIFMIYHRIGKGELSKKMFIEAIDRYEKTHKSCPNCHKVGQIGEVFGYRTISGGTKKAKTIPQSWCRDCRAGKNPT